MYYWGGEKYGIKIKSDCKECDINTTILRDMEQNEFKDKPVEIVIKTLAFKHLEISTPRWLACTCSSGQ